MTCRVICVSRTLGASGEEMARLVAERLGFRYVDDEIIVRAANAAGVSVDEVERAEHTRPLALRVIEALAAVPVVGETGEVFVLPQQQSVSYDQLIEHVIREVASEGNVVVVAHGASIPLAGVDGVLRVLATASPQVRAARVSARQGLGAKAAEKAVEASDRERAQYLKRFYGVGHEQPVHYDLTINMDALSPSRAADLVVQAAKG